MSGTGRHSSHLPEHIAPGLARRAVAVAGWLRRHPDVEAGPSVRATSAFAEVAGHWRRLAGADDLLPAALVALPHRLRVRPGADADELVRQALAATEGLTGGPAPEPPSRRPAATEHRREFMIRDVLVSTGQSPHAPDAPSEERHYGDDEAARLLERLFAPGPAEPTSPGVVATRPGRRGMGDEALATRRLRPGDRSRDLSVRASVRAAVRGRRALTPADLRAAPRQPVAAYDVVLCLDASASMGAAERPVVAPATTALARVLVRTGHRVGAIAFSEEAVLARHISRAPDPLPAGGYAFAYATNLEAGINAGRELLRRQADPDARPHIVLITDAEASSHSGSEEAWGPGGPPRGIIGMSRLLAGAGAEAARRAAVLAATRTRRAGITVSVVYPDDQSDVAFAHTLAAAGGGRARPLR